MSDIDDRDDQETPARTPVLPALRLSLAAAKGEKRDAGIEALAIRYAELLDHAAVEKQYVKALEMIGQAVSSYADDMPLTAGDQLRGALVKITTALAEHTTASDLGPKLLAAMTALNLTPAARSAGKKEQGGEGGGVAVVANPLTLLRDRSADRNGKAG